MTCLQSFDMLAVEALELGRNFRVALVGQGLQILLWKEYLDKMLKEQGESASKYQDLKKENLELQNKILKDENKQLKEKPSKSKWKLGFMFVLVIVIMAMWCINVI
ncbi:hypothetical protein QVD17_19381 [Tagetes erecta]|uniref:Uncharacterized protein n=1 Tax=Tagetes erecta TaxID=13708 RepID=A0AAD8NX72_TARER|nr:hypothetical protein QVD17_19381 [Tagetes erecta]